MAKDSITTEKNRTNKSGANAKGGDVDAARNVDGVAVVERGYETLGSFRLKVEDVMFLDAYAECKADIAAIKKVTGLSQKEVNKIMRRKAVIDEIAEIQGVWQYNRKMKAENAAAKHIQLMEKLESDYDAGDLDQRAKFANPLMKGSETYLKAAGHMNHGGGGGSEGQVIINIDLGGDDKKVKINEEDVIDV